VADHATGRGGTHGDAAISFGNRTSSAAAAAAKVKAHPTRSRACNFVSSCPAVALIDSAERQLDFLADALAGPVAGMACGTLIHRRTMSVDVAAVASHPKLFRRDGPTDRQLGHSKIPLPESQAPRLQSPGSQPATDDPAARILKINIAEKRTRPDVAARHQSSSAPIEVNEPSEGMQSPRPFLQPGRRSRQASQQ
jgi:hypothetical protein